MYLPKLHFDADQCKRIAIVNQCVVINLPSSVIKGIFREVTCFYDL